jgi:hypothetical protein
MTLLSGGSRISKRAVLLNFSKCGNFQCFKKLLEKDWKRLETSSL